MAALLRQWIIPLTVLCVATPHPSGHAGWYAENVEKGADLVTMELRYPHWVQGLYFSCWNMVLQPQGGSFYGGVQSRARSYRQEDQDAFRPPTTWSFWSDPEKYGGGDVLRNVFMHPEVYASMGVQYGGEGTSGSCGASRGASWIRRGDWYRMVMRVWSPEGGSGKESFIGWWMKDVARNEWHHHATYRIPTRVTGLSGNAGFLEGTGCRPEEKREFHRRFGFYRLNGEWRKGDTVIVDVAADRGGGDEYRTVRLLEDDTVFSLTETADPKGGRNLEPGKKHAFTVKQPAEPQLDPVAVTDAKASVYQGQLAVAWEIPAHSSPQLGYRIEVFDNSEFRGNPQSVHAARIPQVRQTRVDTAVGSPSVRLVVTDIYDRERAVPVVIESRATLMPAVAAPKTMRPGLSYQYFEQTDGESDKASRWQRIPDFAFLKPKQQGMARGLESDFRGDRSLGFAFRYAGFLDVPVSGFHTLVLKSCDGSRIKIDGQVILDNDGLHSATERRATVALERGLHRFECDWFRGYEPGHKEWTGLWLGWERPGASLEEIPLTAWNCEDSGDLPEMRLVAEQDANQLRIRPQITAREAKISRVVVFQNGLVWGESATAPFEISGLLSPGTNRLQARLYYNEGRTIDDPRALEFRGVASDLAPWTLTSFGQPGLPHAIRLKDGMMEFVGEGDYLAHQKVRGDFALTCRVDDILTKTAGADGGSWMGLLVKETTDNTGDHFGLYQTAGAGLRGSSDTADFIGSRMSSWEYAKGHPWLRVVRRGHVFTSYSSPDGSAWTKAMEWMKPMRDEVFAGVTMRTIPYRSQALFRGTASHISLNAGALPPDSVKAARGFDPLAPSFSGLVQSLSQPAVLVARTTHDGLRISEDGGATWREAKPGGENPAARAVRSVAIHPRDAKVILCAVGATDRDGRLQSGLWRSADGGATWRLATTEIDFDGRGPARFCGEVAAFDPNQPDLVVAAGETRGLFISRDAGRTWEPLGLAGERITCVAFHPTHQPGYLVVGTCADAELPVFGCGQPAAPAPKADQGRLYVTRDHGKSWDCRIQRTAFGITGIALRDGVFDLMVLATTRGVYTTETLAHNLYQRMEGVERDTPFTALGTDGKHIDPLFHAAPLTATAKEPVVSTGNWQRWIPRPGIPAGAPVVAIKADVADPLTLFIVRTDGILRSRPDGTVQRIGLLAANADTPSPFPDAVAVWNMAEEAGQAAERSRLTVQGNVKLGVSLEGLEREASLRRGGDGRVAEFDGGYLIAGEKAGQALRLSGDQMTFCIRVRFAAGLWSAPLFARHAPDDEFSRILYPAALNVDVIGYSQFQRIKEGQGLEFLWRTTPLKERVRPEYFKQGESPNLLRWHTDWEAKWTPARKGDFLHGLLRLNAPTELLGQDRWHDIVVRFNRVKIEMFVDGVLLDEEWPHGKLHQFVGPFLIGAGFQEGKLVSGFRGQIDHVALWNRALNDDEVLALSGGREEASRRDLEILGPRKPVGQYWRPHGFNTSIGDCMAFAHGGVFHIFFLSDRRHGGSKWGLQALPWGHVSTKDFIRWEEHPCPLDITEPWECCLGTGTFAFHNGRYHLIYVKHDRRAWFAENPNFGDAIFMATSDDGVHFKKETNPLMVPGWFGENDINPGLHPDKTDGGYLLSLCNWKVFKSKDLKTFEPRANITTPAWWPCTSYWKWNAHYYFTSCGMQWTSLRPIEDPSAKWDAPPHQTLNDGIRVSQTAEFKGRYIMVGFTPEPPNAHFGGELLVRELIQHPDGTLGTKWLEEMIPQSGQPLKLPFKATAGDASAEGSAIRLSAPDGFAAGAYDGVPQNVRVTLRVKAKAGTRHFGLCVRGLGDYATGCELQFEPARQRVQFAPVADGQMAKEPGNWRAIDGVSGLDQPFLVDLIVKDDLVDACIDSRRTLITRNRAKLTGDRLFFFVSQGEAAFEDIRVRPLQEP